MKKWNRILAVALVFVTALGLSACNSQESPTGGDGGGTKKIGYVVACLLYTSIKDEELIAKALAADGVAALFCNGVPPSLAGEVLRKLGRQDIVLVGFGPSERTAQLMREGYIQVLIDEHPEEYAYTALRTLFRYLTEDEVPERLIHTPVSVLTSECLPLSLIHI